MSTFTGRSNIPRPSKSRSASRIPTPRDQPSAPLSPSPRPTPVPKSPAPRPRTLSTNVNSSLSSSDRGSSPDRPRARSVAKSPSRLRPKEPEPPTPAKPAPAMSMKEAIALKRAEAKKASAQKALSEHGQSSGFDDMLPTSAHAADEDELGRLSIRETIERARSSGSLNIASRDLSCLPSALFQIHLSVTPEKLSSVPDEPPLPEKSGKKFRSNPTTWYDQQDLTFLRARNNQIIELQPEISLFGSLKTIDLQNNRLASLPDSFADLTSLINLDLSHNALTALPSHFFSLPSLSVLDLSHNSLAALPFSMPFDPATSAPAPTQRSNEFFSPPEIIRATRPLPRLTSLDASHNKIVSSTIHHDALPQDLKTFSLMCNPLGDVAELLISLSALTQLVALRLSRCDIDDTSFPAALLSSASRPTFPKLAVLDLEETHATQAAVSSALSGLTQSINFELSVIDERTVPTGTLAVAVGKRIVREAWEIEADRHVQRLRERRSAANLRDASVSESPPPPPLPQPIQKEQWEIDAEQGLLSEGAQRRTRAEAAAQHAAEDSEAVVGPSTATAASHSTPVLGRYWNPHTLTLTLPPSAGRSVRHAPGAAAEEEIVPRVTLPLALIMTQPFTDTLRTLELRGRRAEPGIVLPTSHDESQPLLPRLETLNLEGCALSDVVPGAEAADAGGTLGVLARLFPAMRTLELAYNDFTGAALGRGVLEQLLFVGDGDSSERAGLRRLVLCGNRIEELHGLRELAQVVFGAGADVGNLKAMRGKWTLEELDVRQNSIAVLPGELGLLPLDSFLVDGNLFRVPPRRVWEREGTKGLLTWLRGRLEAQ